MTQSTVQYEEIISTCVLQKSLSLMHWNPKFGETLHVRGLNPFKSPIVCLNPEFSSYQIPHFGAFQPHMRQVLRVHPTGPFGMEAPGSGRKPPKWAKEGRKPGFHGDLTLEK